jgi:hypothetical protein
MCTVQYLIPYTELFTTACSVVDRHRFDADLDLDPTYFDTDPDLDPDPTGNIIFRILNSILKFSGKVRYTLTFHMIERDTDPDLVK